MSTRDLVATVEAAAATQAPLALVTLVRTAGSTYRRAGARLCVTAEAEAIGLISGGCLEPHIAEAACEVIATHVPRQLAFDMRSPLDGLAGFGLGCQGALEVFVERFEAWHWDADTRRLFCGSNLGSTPRITATVFNAPAALRSFLGTSVLADDGSHLLGSLQDATQGAGSNSKDSSHALHHAASLLTQRLHILALRALDEGRALTCTIDLPLGSVECFIDVVAPTHHLTICGAGPDARPLVTFARELDWRVSLIDHRPAVCDLSLFPGAERIIYSQPEDVVQHILTGEHASAVIMTHNYAVDLRLLPQILPLDLAYIGLLGPKRRGERLLQDLAEEFVPTATQRKRLYSPVGLKLGGETPAAIALAIVAEIQATLSRRDHASLPSLRNHNGPIHSDAKAHAAFAGARKTTTCGLHHEENA